MRRIVLAMALIGIVGTALAPSEASAWYGRVWQGRPGILSQTVGVRLYYSNAFRGLIPGTGYGGFRRPAFGYRGY